MTMVSGSLPDAEGIRQSVLDGISIVLARGVAKAATDELDFYECNFFRAFRAPEQEHCEDRAQKAEAGIRNPKQGRDRRPWDRSVGVGDRGIAEPGGVGESDELLDEVKRVLTPDELNAVVLCRVLKVKEESKNPEEITAARLCNCTGRTLRNRLRRADAKLSRFKEGK